MTLFVTMMSLARDLNSSTHKVYKGKGSWNPNPGSTGTTSFFWNSLQENPW
jgi:hypothetical protein